MKKFNKLLNLILPLLTIFVIALIWQISSRSIDNQYILPSVESTLNEFFLQLSSTEFYRALFFTLLRSLIAFATSFVLAFALAVLSVKNKCVKSLIAPLISIMRALPTIAIVLLLLFWTNSQIAPIVVTALVVLPTSFTHIESAFRSLDKTVSEAGEVDGANTFQVFMRVEFAQALPLILNAIGGGISLNFKLMVAAEVLSQTANSIGLLLNTAKVYFEMAQMMAIVLVAVIFGVIIESIFDYIAKKTGEWKN
ncbi:MAG: ABC transporter permease subunit [Clostridia bacterium]|nr:ABC transporter permease subunit [Clostridia bacterium]